MTKETLAHQELVKNLSSILKETGLSEIEYEVDGLKIRVARQLVVNAHPHDHFVPTTAASLPHPTEIPPAGTSQAQGPGTLKSPMVGNVYLGPSPNSPPFVSEGAAVKKGQTVLIIEAMKVMNQIKAHQDGIIQKILVNNGDPVEFDQALLIIA
jgi:acetyl-CoA carboxylase biotin carboxyl carrier protein